ncbi:hypothetical protein [Rhizobacter sp. P5_C2]
MALHGINGPAERAPRPTVTRQNGSVSTTAPSRARDRGTNALGNAVPERGTRSARPDAALGVASNVRDQIYGAALKLRESPTPAGLAAGTIAAAKGVLSLYRAFPQLTR